MNKKKLILTGGGTAGHILPNLALLPYLEKQGFEALYFGSKSSMDQSIVSTMSKVPFIGISSGKLRRYFDFRNFIDFFFILLGFIQSILWLHKIKPALVFAKGGFVSVPVVWAAWCLKIPVLLHESDISPGLANRLMMPFSKCICLSFPQTLSQIPSSKARLTGIPVRSFLLNGDAKKGRELCNFDQSKPILMIMGGSQGSMVLDRLVWEKLEVLLESYQILHLGRKQQENHQIPQAKGYKFFEFVSQDLGHLYACADIMVSRSGANTLFEILQLKKPALLIPLPRSVSRGEQIANAQAFHELACGEILQQEDLTIEKVMELCEQLYKYRRQYVVNMEKWSSRQAAEKIMELIVEYSK
jgi:UDP-N-acetylglucosamine--N-acetylmuramyl-(pentapeptide) pyrophosphoryl-undecaprenol N-acetylglucosamine transferase